ncbi:arylsulfatase [Niabella aurantiaca]|uniref:arylsulfatase n=1 Tax=Niabella aurantiaca TaxID=379900 RepID=UPI00037A7500|nr:arylsulfatase [Niabella aurantiaca]
MSLKLKRRSTTRRKAILILWVILVSGMTRIYGTEKPNIILIVADDMGYSDLGCYGGEISTPNLDKLAEEGMRFAQFYNQAVCAISRASFISGTYPRFGTGPFLKPDMVTLADVLATAGYATILSGKWHLGDGANSPVNRGFQEFYGFEAGAVEYFDPLRRDPPFVNHSRPAFFFMHNRSPVSAVPDHYYVTDAITDHAISQIEKYTRAHQPFFLHVAFNAPHYPLQALPGDIAKYKGRYDAGYEELRKKRYEGAIKAGVIDRKWDLPPTDKKKSDFKYDQEVRPWSMLTPGEQKAESARMEVYAAMVDRLDQNVGRLLTRLKQLKIEDNTIIIFFSDNGACASVNTSPENIARYHQYNKGKQPGGRDSYLFAGPGWATAQSSPFRRYKVWTNEGGISTPMIVRWKGHVAAGTLTQTPMHLVDLMPTFMELSGAVYPKQHHGVKILPYEGISMMDVLENRPVQKERAFGWYLYGNKAYRKGKWKIIWGTGSEKWELYDMENDRTETRDLSARDPKRLKHLISLWDKWAVRSQVPADDSAMIQQGSRIIRNPAKTR